ncbi:hypothetical protein [Variovorax sp. KK3]|uniref:hypothetical protein n=1 Tax=Variovorax sp. KK3 TaxID=1855728 RepID=UPI00097BA980|nr:hypothetical protein [Variovorax sp. KK3]
MADAISPDIWIAACAHALQLRWRTVNPRELEEMATELWRDARLRALPPRAAAEAWLGPVMELPS